MVITSVILPAAPLATSSASLTSEVNKRRENNNGGRPTGGSFFGEQQALPFRKLRQRPQTRVAVPPSGGKATMNNDGGENAPSAAQHVHYGQQHAETPSYNTTQQQNNYSQMIVNSNGDGGRVGGNSRMRNSDNEEEQPLSRVMQQPTPLFERLVTEEVQELKAYARIIESQNRRLSELERVHGDLETRLEQESRGRQQLEATLEERERQWHDRFTKLEKDRDHWKEVVQMEQTKNARLIEQVVRKDQDIQKMLQRKYDQPRGEGGHFTQPVRNFQSQRANQTERDGRSTPNSSSRSPQVEQHKSPHEILAANGSAEAVRARNVAHTLLDFFSMT